MLDRLARPPDPLKRLKKPELPDAGKHLQHALANHFLPLDLLDFLGRPVEIHEDEVVAVVDRLVHRHSRAGVVQNRVELRPHHFRRLTRMRFLCLV